MNLEQAQKVLNGALKKAKELGVKVSVAVVDVNGNLLSFARMDGALAISPKFAIAKAYTSASLAMPTSDLAGYTLAGKPYAGLTDLFGGELTTISGGYPVKDKEHLLGGIGVGGSYDVDQDGECAKAGAESV